MVLHEYVTLNTGAKMPTLGLGTWKSPPGKVEHAVECALKAGYRHIDTATGYQNEKEVGEGIKASGVPRSQIFLTTKLRNDDHPRPEEGLLESIEKLDTYVDLWLMHWPAPWTVDGKPDLQASFVDTWKRMEAVYKKHSDKVRAIGVSNFSVDYLEKLLPQVDIVPAANQIELHPSLPQPDVREYCRSKGISVTAYCPLGSDNSPLLEHPVVVKIAEKHNVHPPNVLISLWANVPGTTVIPKSITPSRIEANKKLIDLSDDEVQELLDIHKTKLFRVCTPEGSGFGDLGFPDRK